VTGVPNHFCNHPMSAGFHEIEAELRYLTTDVGGRRTGVFSGYSGLLYYGEDDYDGFQYFPDIPDGKWNIECPILNGECRRNFDRLPTSSFDISCSVFDIPRNGDERKLQAARALSI